MIFLVKFSKKTSISGLRFLIAEACFLLASAQFQSIRHILSGVLLLIHFSPKKLSTN